MTRPACTDSTSSRRELPAPSLPAAEVAAIVRERWGSTSRSTPRQPAGPELPRPRDGAPVGVVKITNPAFTSAELAAQDNAASRIAAHAPDLRIATTSRDDDGSSRSAVAETSEGPLTVRLLEYLGGGTLTGGAYLSPRPSHAWASSPRTRASRSRASSTPASTASCSGTCATPIGSSTCSRRTTPTRPGGQVTDAATRVGRPRRRGIRPLPAGRAPRPHRRQRGVHAEHGIRTPDGMIDFGDVTSSWAVAELAITISSVLHHAGAEPASVLPAIRAFHALRPLSAAGGRAIWLLVVLRGAVLVVSGEHQVQLDGGGNAYAASGIDREWRIFEQATSVPTEVMTGVIAAALGVPARRGAGGSRPASRPRGIETTPGFDFDGSAIRLDVSITSDDVDGGAWLDPGLEERLALAAPTAGRCAAWIEGGTHGSAEPHPIGRPRRRRRRDRRVVRRAAAAGVAARRRAAGDRGGVMARPSSTAPAGAHARTASRVEIAPARAAGAAPCARSTPRDGSPSPRTQRVRSRDALVPGSSTTGIEDAAELIARRDRAFAEVQEHYYEAPPRIERGWREHLSAPTGARTSTR